MTSGFFGSALMIVVLLGISAVLMRSRLPLGVKTLLLAGLGLRIVGTYTRMTLAADSILYFRWGKRYAEYFARFDFSPLFDSTLWRSADWMGTNAVAYPAGFAIAILGPSELGVFLVYTLMAFLGVVAYGVAFQRSVPGIEPKTYWAWILLFASLLFWPSSIGKEAIMLLGLGVAAYGFLKGGDQSNWFVTALGILIVFSIRAQVAAVVIFAIILTYVFRQGSMSPLRAFQSVAIVCIGLFVMANSLEASRIGGSDLSAIEEYVTDKNFYSDKGGSAIGAAGFGFSSVPQAVLNVLFRPFLWEAHNVPALISALEVVLMWGLIIVKRHQLMAALRHWRESRLTRFALLFTVLYVIGLGMNLGNLGIIARQRVLVFPMLFAFVEAGAMYLPRRAPKARRSWPLAPHDHATLTPQV